ncbi:MAG: aftD [Nocardioides sp.]|nr:aftD [Nocardioides sp.]
MLAGCALLIGLALVQDPGLLSSDTKFDLVADPANFLGRSLHLWDPRGAFGQVQNQAYGYLWPMGPFFTLGWLAHLPGWVIQRLWIGLVMAVAFSGSAKVARALGVRSDFACLVAGIAFALSPRMITTLGPISIEAWPSALAPWVLLPLVTGATRGSPRRAAALSALAIAMVGGVNAAATFAVIPLGAIWLLTRTPGPRRRSMMLWWPAFTLLGTLWWLVPLFLLGAYSPPFLDFIETTSVTTFPTTLFDTLRGTSDWVPYADSGSRAGNQLITSAYLVLDSAVVLMLGFVGLIDRRNPHRAFLGLSLLVGVLMVTAGHHGAVEGWFADSTRALLDGSLSPLRNVHKFDPAIRLPLVLGLAFMLDRAVAHRPAEDDPWPGLVRFNRVVLIGLTVVVVLAAATPALTNRLVPGGATMGVPTYWEQAAAWLDDESDGTTALVVPGAPFGDYLWGEPKDEPLQYLGTTRWAVRNVIPLAPPGNIRMLDEVESHLAQGTGSKAFTEYLRRAGVRFLVVRNDLQRSDDVPDPVLVHQAIAQSPGIAQVAQFGPPVGGDPVIDGPKGRVLVNGGWQARYPAIEIFEVEDRVHPAVSSDTPATVVGGPEDLDDLMALDTISEDPVVLATDATEAPQGRLVLTDGLRARERYFARIHDGDSAAITPGDRRHSGNPHRDYLIDSHDRWSTTVRLDGAAAVSASSSRSDADAIGGSRRGNLPYAAVDGSPETSWVSGYPGDAPSWWMLRLDEPAHVTSVEVATPPGYGQQAVTVETANGTSDVIRIGPGGSRLVRLPEGDPVSWIRVTDASSGGGRVIALSEVSVPGVQVERSLVLPSVPADWGTPDAVVLRADHDARTGCVRIDDEERCRPSQARASEEPFVMRRVVDLAAPVDLEPRLTAWPRAGEALDRLVLDGQAVAVTASSSGVPDPKASPVAMIDGDLGTSWIADVQDKRPVIQLAWLGKKVIDSIDLSLDDAAPARLPTGVQLSWPGGVRDVSLGPDGAATFPAIRTDRLQVTVTDAEDAVSLAFDDATTDLGIGIGELRLGGLSYLPLGLSADPVRYDCGSGPTLAVGSWTLRTAVVASPLALSRGAEADVEPCGTATPVTIRLAKGENDVTLSASDALAPGTVVLVAPGDDVVTTLSSALTSAPDAVTRHLAPDDGDAVVAMRENTNPGWTAEQDGHTLDPLTLDGWQQGWQVSGGDSVTARYAPDREYRLGLLIGLVCLLSLVAIVLLTRRRWTGPMPAPVRSRAVPAVLLWGGALVGSGLVAGTVGVLIGAVTAVLAVLARRTPPELQPWLFAWPLLVAGFAYWLEPWGSSSGWAGDQAWIGYLVPVPVVAVLVGAAAERRPGKKRFRRWEGRSIRR